MIGDAHRGRLIVHSNNNRNYVTHGVTARAGRKVEDGRVPVRNGRVVRTGWTKVRQIGVADWIYTESKELKYLTAPRVDVSKFASASGN